MDGNIKNVIMKNLFLLFLLLIFSVSCNKDFDFEDNEIKAVYFPIQYPVRTLILGEDRIDNSIDLQHAFNIGVCIGGMYANNQDWTVDYIVKPDLLNNIKASDSYANPVDLKILPSEYYTLSPEGQVKIPEGSMNGKIRVQLNDNFFNDPNSYKLCYVLPLYITDSNASSILRGEIADGVTDPNPHSTSDYLPQKTPKDFTMFAVKYINLLHGNFFMRGVQYLNGEIDKVFHEIDLERNKVVFLETSGYNEAIYNVMGQFTGNAYRSKLEFGEEKNGEGEIKISSVPGAKKITGTGRYYKSTTEFAKKYGSWLVSPETGNPIPHLTIVLDMKSDNIIPGRVYEFKDTLVFRDNGVKFETYNVEEVK